MAKKSSSSSVTNTETAKFCAFWGLVFSAAAGLVSFFFWLLVKCGVTISWSGTVISICNLLSMLGMLIGIGLAAWQYVRYKTKVWKVIYWIALVLYVLGVLGIFHF